MYEIKCVFEKYYCFFFRLKIVFKKKCEIKMIFSNLLVNKRLWLGNKEIMLFSKVLIEITMLRISRVVVGFVVRDDDCTAVYKWSKTFGKKKTVVFEKIFFLHTSWRGSFVNA